MDLDTLEQARISKDKSFDGQFYFGVTTTNIFCRPSCPAPVAKSKNVVYFDSIYQALDQGFVPCYRCRPDIMVDYYSGGNPVQSINVMSALDMIYSGYLNSYSVKDLAEKHDLSERHLRKLFSDYIGISPHKIAVYH